MSKKELPQQVGGDHYSKSAIQPVEYIMANGLSFCEGNVVKYITRYPHKGGLDDLLKARAYVDILIHYEREKSKPTDRSEVREVALSKIESAINSLRPSEALRVLHQASENVKRAVMQYGESTREGEQLRRQIEKNRQYRDNLEQ